MRSRIDWKYALSLPLTDPGFHFSIFTEFRQRLIEGNAEQLLLDKLLERLQDLKLLKSQRQRTDSTHILAAVRNLNRLETLGETFRAALNSLATAAPDWLMNHLHSDWVGYKAHVTEICGEDCPHLITQVYTTLSTVSDDAAVEPVHQALSEKSLLPTEHLMDTGYVTAEHLVNSRTQYGVEIVGPVRSDPRKAGTESPQVCCFTIQD